MNTKSLVSLITLLGLGQLLQAQTTILFEGFESAFPGIWSVGNSGSGPTWRDVNSAFGGEGTQSGNWKGYCAGTAYPFNSTEPNPVYADNMVAYMETALDLRGYTSVQLSFWSKIPSIESGWDFARVFIDGGLVWSTDSPQASWSQVTLNLSGYVGGVHTLRFEFDSDSSNTYEGWYLDDIWVTGVQTPANDTCQNALFLTDGVPYSMDTSGATPGDGTPSCQASFGKGVWFRFIAPNSGTVEISTCGSSFDTVLQVYAGGDANCDFMTQVDCSDDNGPLCAGNQASVRFSAPGPRPYRILAGGWNSQSGTLTIVAHWWDTIPPTITCPNNVTVQCLADVPARPTTLTEFQAQGGQASDNWDTSLAYSSSDSPWLSCGTIYRTHTVTDDAGNAASCVQSITVWDTIPPVIGSLNNRTIECGTPWDFDTPTVSDNCGSPSLTILNTTATFVPDHGPGWFAADFNDGQLPPGTVSSGTIPPYVGAEHALHLTDAIYGGQQNYWTIPFAGPQTFQRFKAHWRTLIGGGGDPNYGSLGADGFSFSVGMNLGTGFLPEEGAANGLSVTVDTWDNGGAEVGIEIRWNGQRVGFTRSGDGLNSGAAKAPLRKGQFVEAWVEVTPTGFATFAFDTFTVTAQLPSYSGLAANQYVFAARTGSAFDNHWIDDVLIDDYGSAFRRTRSWRAADACGNAVQSGQTITVRDTTPPVMTCAPDQTVECGTAWTFTPPTVSDACDGANVSVRIVSTVTNWIRSCPTLFSATRTWEAEDSSTNRARCAQTVSVRDSIPPIITCPSNLTAQCLADVPPPPTTLAQFMAQGGLAWDNCDTDLPYASSDSPLTGGTCGGTIFRTHTVEDDCTNLASCVQIITIHDTTPPTITCAANKVVECGTAWTFDTPTATDNCGSATITVVSTVTNVACGNTFVATRTWQATDACGNSAQCSQSVTVVDTAGPILTCGGPKTVPYGTAWSFDLPTVWDACSGASENVQVVSTVTNGSPPCAFTATRSWRATDPCGNTTQCSQTVTVVEATPPAIVCPSNILAVTDSGSCSKSNVTFVATATDNCPGVAVSCVPPGGSAFPVGTTPVICTARDAAGNVTSCSFNVIIQTTQPAAGDFTTDFEAGYLRGWTKTGTAFDSQPTLDDNPTARGRGEPANQAGRWWIGTYENYQGRAGQTSGDIQGDAPTGTLISPEFVITGDTLTFLIGGGTHFIDDPDGATIVELDVDGQMVFYATGNNNETMVRASWNVSSFKGRRGVIKIIDANSGWWGHINCDDFQMLDAQGRRLAFSINASSTEAPAFSVHPVPSGPDWTTTSTEFITIGDGNPPVRTPASSLSCGIVTEDLTDLIITFSGEVNGSPGARVWVRALVDGEVTSPSDIVAAIGNYTGTRTFNFTKKSLAAGGHWVEMQWSVDAGGTAYLGDATLTLCAASAATPLAQLLLNAASSGPWIPTAAAYWDNVPDMTGSLVTTAAGDLAISFTAEAYTAGGSSAYVRATVDGQAAAPSDVEFVAEGFTGVRSFTFVKQNVPAGTHSIAVQWHATAAQTSYVGDRTLSVVAAPELTKFGGLTVQAAPSGPDLPTTSTTWTDVPDILADIATAANSSLEITFSSEVNGNGSGRVFLRALVDGQPAEPSDVVFVVGASFGTRSFTFTRANLSAGPHEVRMQWKVDAGTTGFIADRTLVLNYWQSTPGNLSAPAFGLKPVVGTRKVLVILWDPHRPDHPAPTRAAVENVLFGGKPSVADYYLKNSGGRFHLESAGVLGWYDAALPWSYYWGPDDPGDANGDGWIHPHVQKWAEAVRDADVDFDFAAYDVNGDHYLSRDELGILIVIPQNDPFGTMRNAVGRELPVQDLIVDGVKIDTITEAYIGAPPSAPLVAHELSHLLFNTGDMYFNFFQPYAAGPYSLMDQSDYLNHLDPVHKLQLGWLTPRLVVSNAWQRLRAIENSQEVLLLYDPLHGADEYFLIENRWPGCDAYDAALPFKGLAVWHVMENPAVYGALPAPPGVDPAQWNTIPAGDAARRAIRMIRPIYGPPYNTALWDGSSATTGYDLLSTDANPNHVTLKWADGTPSGFSIVCMPAPGPEVTVAVLHTSFAGTLAGPPLTIQRDRSLLHLSWPAAYRCFQLERANTLPASSWFPVSPLPQIVGEENVVTFSVPNGNQFYRLHKP